MDYEGLYEAFMAGIETALPGGGTVLGGLRAVDQNPMVRRFNDDVNYAKNEIGTMAGRAATDLGEAVSSVADDNVLADYVRHLGTGLPTKAITSLRKAPRAMHPEAAAILKQVTGQEAPEEEQTNELELTKDLLEEITSGRRVVGKYDKLKSRPGQKGFSRGGKGYQPAEDPRISAARIRAGSERQKNNSAAFARIMAGVAQNPDVTPDKAAALARALLRGGQPVPAEDEELQTLLREAMKGGKLPPRLAELLSARHGG